MRKSGLLAPLTLNLGTWKKWPSSPLGRITPGETSRYPYCLVAVRTGFDALDAPDRNRTTTLHLPKT